MIYELKQKIRHSSLGNKITRKLADTSLFPFCYEMLAKLNLTEIGYYFNSKKAEIAKIVSALEDQESKDLYKQLIRWRKRQRWDIKNFSPVQYFPEDIVHLSEEEVFVDCGAFTGDTILSFLNACHHKYKKIVAFEPDPSAAEQLKAHHFQNCTHLPCGVWDKKETLLFHANGQGNSTLEKGLFTPETTEGWKEFSIQLERIDDLPVCADMTFLKMDLEGAEQKALKGAEQTIRKNKPKLAICIYHTEQDMVEIPLWILSLNMGYKLYVRHHSDTSSETVLYAL